MLQAVSEPHGSRFWTPGLDVGNPLTEPIHEHGIVHRDLKTANVKVTAAVKELDIFMKMVSEPEKPLTQVQFVLNWTEELKRRAPAK